MQFLIEIEPAQFSESPEYLRRQIEAFTRRLAAFHARPAEPAVQVLLLEGDHVAVPVDSLIELQRKAGA